MDYRDLLKKYMNHILSCERIDYISKCNHSREVHFTDEEINELENISNEVNNEEFDDQMKLKDNGFDALEEAIKKANDMSYKLKQ